MLAFGPAANNLIIVLFTLNVNAQSLSEQTGETKSLYNAICIYNDITPGDIGMTEFRVLATKYAKEVGCTNYELYLYNGGNNLYILYFDASEHTDEEVEPFWGEDQIDFTNAGTDFLFKSFVCLRICCLFRRWTKPRFRN